MHFFHSRFLGTRLFASALYHTYENSVIEGGVHRWPEAHRRGGKISNSLVWPHWPLLHSSFPLHNQIKRIAHCHTSSDFRMLDCTTGFYLFISPNVAFSLRPEGQKESVRVCWPVQSCHFVYGSYHFRLAFGKLAWMLCIRIEVRVS